MGNVAPVPVFPETVLGDFGVGAGGVLVGVPLGGAIARPVGNLIGTVAADAFANPNVSAATAAFVINSAKPATAAISEVGSDYVVTNGQNAIKSLYDRSGSQAGVGPKK